MLTRRLCQAALLALACAPVAANAADEFYLKDGDRVVFYGDSITDQRLYTTFTETFVVTRFPDRNITFVHSGWGGDRVTGGGGGPVDRRLARDVFAYKPTVVTVMLGMNDASYRAYDGKVFETYAKGYKHIVESLKSKYPDARLTLIKPSPFDDVTRKPNFEGGYNAVLVRYGEFLQELAKEKSLDTADLNTYVVEATKKANEADPSNATKLNPDRVHPGPGGQILMAAALLKAWNAPSVVSAVTLNVDGSDLKTEADHAEVTDAKVEGDNLAWDQLDEALPFPINLKDPVVKLAVRSSDVLESLDRESLTVKGLKPGSYELKVDGKLVETFSADDLAKGVNLAELPTPMVKQAEAVHKLTLKHNDVHFTRWRTVQVPLESEDPTLVQPALDALDAIEAKLVKDQREAAKPKTHRFALEKKTD